MRKAWKPLWETRAEQGWGGVTEHFGEPFIRLMKTELEWYHQDKLPVL